MKVKQLNRLAKIVDKGNEILAAIEDLEIALHLIDNDPKAHVSVAVSDQEYIIQISDHIRFQKIFGANSLMLKLKGCVRILSGCGFNFFTSEKSADHPILVYSYSLDFMQGGENKCL